MYFSSPKHLFSQLFYEKGFYAALYSTKKTPPAISPYSRRKEDGVIAQ
jgi:hypothetical protein